MLLKCQGLFEATEIVEALKVYYNFVQKLLVYSTQSWAKAVKDYF